MKISRIALALVILAQLSSCEELSEKEYELRVEIVDDKGKPVPSAKVQAARRELIKDSPVPMTRNIRLEFSSDETGIALFKFKSIPTPGGVAIHKQNYYSSFYPVEWRSAGSTEGQLHKGEIKALLKPVKNPIPMHASAPQSRIRIPALNKNYGYDLILASPLPPLGIGKSADFFFEVVGDYTDRSAHDLKMIISFPNKHEGFVAFETPQRESMTEPHMDGSAYISGYAAPESGYANQLVRVSKKSPADGKAATDNDPHRNFFFRVRTAVDNKGNVIQAHYGKIYGDLGFVGGNHAVSGHFASFKWIASYFNPTPNDRNVEFDPKRNLNPDGNVQQP